MAFDGDPYRTLGLAPGASLDEVKRAYRRLAKTNHPDAAGSGALPRFLAIQAAYEQLAEGSGSAGARPHGPSNGARRSSEADPGRADATRRAYGGRARARRTADEPAGRGRTTGGTPGAAGTPGASGGGQAARGRPAGTGDPGSTDPEAARRRGKATLGSTSYDDADAGPLEPDWSGASWYGTTSGTYWTINPKEYADPRKHGPEYQARARRASGPRPDANASTPGPTSGPDLDASEAHETVAGAHGAAEAVGPTRAGGASGGSSRDARASGQPHTTSSWWDSTSGLSEPADEASAADAAWRPAGQPPSPADDQVPDPARALANLARALTDPRTGGLRGRVMRAFVGWLPIALGLGWLLGELTGCGRFAATCDPSINPLMLMIQGGALVALLLLPVVASLAASAALGLVTAAVAATLILSATGTAADEGSRRATLGLLLLVAWLAGLTIAIVQRVRSASSGVGPVS